MKTNLKINLSWAHLGIALSLPVVAFFLAEASKWKAPADRLRDLDKLFEVYLPVLAVLLFARLVSLEFEEDTAELLLSYPVSRAKILAGKLAVGGAALAVAYVATLIAVVPFYEGENAWRLVGISLPPALFLVGLTVFASTLGRSTLAGITAGGGTWVAQLFLGGKYTNSCTCSATPSPVPARTSIPFRTN